MTGASDDIGEFIGCFQSLYGGAAEADAREGATPAEVDEFVRAAGFPLPPLYLGYLREFGRRDSALALGDDASCDVRAVLRYLREQQGGDFPPAPPGCVLISVRGVSLSRALEYAPDCAEPRVVVNDMDEVILPIASSFRVHLYRQAWSGRWFHTTAQVSMSRQDDALLGEAAAFAESIGFTSLWFNDRYRYCAERGNARLYAEIDLGGVTLRLHAPGFAERIDLRARFKSALGLQG